MEREIEFNKVSIKMSIVQQHDNIVLDHERKKREEKGR
jgi:hypothetical protein